jgi:hypothetical protein
MLQELYLLLQLQRQLLQSQQWKHSLEQLLEQLRALRQLLEQPAAAAAAAAARRQLLDSMDGGPPPENLKRRPIDLLQFPLGQQASPLESNQTLFRKFRKQHTSCVA